jgi:hypothetical protein
MYFNYDFKIMNFAGQIGDKYARNGTLKIHAALCAFIAHFSYFFS